MSKPYYVALIGLIGLLGSPQYSCYGAGDLESRETGQSPAALVREVPESYEGAIPPRPGRKGPRRDRLPLPLVAIVPRPDLRRFVRSDQGVVVHTVRLKLDDKREPMRIVTRESAGLKTGHWERIANDVTKWAMWELTKRGF